MGSGGGAIPFRLLKIAHGLSCLLHEKNGNNGNGCCSPAGEEGDSGTSILLQRVADRYRDLHKKSNEGGKHFVTPMHARHTTTMIGEEIPI
jgi:hypothetical protein